MGNHQACCLSIVVSSCLLAVVASSSSEEKAHKTRCLYAVLKTILFPEYRCFYLYFYQLCIYGLFELCTFLCVIASSVKIQTISIAYLSLWPQKLVITIDLSLLLAFHFHMLFFIYEYMWTHQHTLTRCPFMSLWCRRFVRFSAGCS